MTPSETPPETPSADRTPAGGLVWFDEPAPPRATEQLSRERIVAAALDLADREPTGEITMRALAARLGVRSPMALYRYVGSKDGLADLMADEIYGLIRVRRGEGWRAALDELGRTGWQAVQQHPWFARLAFSRPPLGPHALRLYDDALAELEPLGLDAAARMGFVNTVLGHVLGSGRALLEERAMRARVGLPSDRDLDKAAAPYLERIAAQGGHPHFSRWAADPARHAPPPQSFERVLGWLLDGLATQLAE
ncbi:TetR family transcriptional regulator [Streptomyces sp. SID8381]|uniref:TetR/AcrR family transcriptional regulator n=1 Tax=unclassified Streptomyces TaxID=2593676 RepID=UPI00035F3941|nr:MULTISPECIES: TetR/AcrR family transcriptional regulator [unclassified Streptomyces]MYX26473.1 TetR family transcriptional regulator [Streptomyces sp. SID8381]